MSKQLDADNVHKFIEYFKEESELTEEDKNTYCTYWCESNSECGFVFRCKAIDMGITMLIVKKFIRHDELLALMEVENG